MSAEDNSERGSKRWKSDEKIQLMKLYSEGKSYEEIGTSLNRSANAIKLRLESIVYDNLVKGKSLSILTRMLNTTSDTIKQLYYSHKSFKQGKGEPVIDVNFADFDKQPVQNMYSMDDLNRHNRPEPRTQDRHMIVGTRSGGTGFPVTGQAGSGVPGFPVTGHPTSTLMHRGNRNAKIEKNIEKIETENRVMESMIKNYRMKRQVRKLYVDGKLDKKNTVMYETLLGQKH
jgi:hypothetical protein